MAWRAGEPRQVQEKVIWLGLSKGESIETEDAPKDLGRKSRIDEALSVWAVQAQGNLQVQKNTQWDELSNRICVNFYIHQLDTFINICQMLEHPLNRNKKEQGSFPLVNANFMPSNSANTSINNPFAPETNNTYFRSGIGQPKFCISSPRVSLKKLTTPTTGANKPFNKPGIGKPVAI